MYNCKKLGKMMSVQECSKCFLLKEKKYPTRATCQLHNIDWLKELKEISEKANLAGLYTERDMKFLQLCNRRKFITHIKEDKYSYNEEYINFLKEF